MGIIHRVMAIVTFTYFGIHLGFLGYFFIFKCPTSRMKFLFGPDSLIPTLRDVKDFIAMLRWFLWLGPRPKLDRWVYFEKFDYWGAFWGYRRHRLLGADPVDAVPVHALAAGVDRQLRHGGPQR